MKKVLLTLFSLVLFSVVASADTGKPVKKAKAKTSHAVKSGKTAAKCPNRPGCICH